MSSSSSMLLRLLRNSGACPPSLLLQWKSDVFEDAVLMSLDHSAEGLFLYDDMAAGKQFMEAVTLADTKGVNKKILEQRRSVILAVTKLTKTSNEGLKYILSHGFLTTVKTWLDDIIKGVIGGLDMLLHLLDSLIKLPVSKEMLVSCNLDKVLVSLEKHNICISGRNESAIKSRISKIKDKWPFLAKVKLNEPSSKIVFGKRSSKALSSNDTTDVREVKKPKILPQENRSKMSTASLISKVTQRNTATQKVTSSDSKQKKHEDKSLSAAEVARLKAQERRLASVAPEKPVNIVTEEEESSNSEVVGTQCISENKSKKSIRWVDEEIGQERNSKREFINNEQPFLNLKDEQYNKMSLSDRRKLYNMQERENMKKNEFYENEEEKTINLIPWHQPLELSPVSGHVPIQANSNELIRNQGRIFTVVKASYRYEIEVPKNPKPLSDSEVALNMASQISTNTECISFFKNDKSTFSPPLTSIPTPQPFQAPVPSGISTLNQQPFSPTTGIPLNEQASLEFVLLRGLPHFLVGSNVHVLQTLVSTPGLLDSYKDSNGLFDLKLMNLVSTMTKNLSLPLTQNIQSHHNMQNALINMESNTQVNYNNSNSNLFAGGYSHNNSSVPSFLPQSQSSSYLEPKSSKLLTSSEIQENERRSNNINGFRGDQNGTEANLHLSGYGPTTTVAQIRELFAPIVEVTEIVSKNGFSFINTIDPEGAKRAREVLNGSILGGRRVRINPAAKKAYEPDKKGIYLNKYRRPEGLNINVPGQVDYDKIRDERGNPATKNLFVAGFGTGTTEQQLNDMFSKFVIVTGTILKGTFAFVNTRDKASAVKAREALSGSVINGGPVRINFAKESGRLGTNFDMTYGPKPAKMYTRVV